MTRAKRYFRAASVVTAAIFGGSLLAHEAPAATVVVTTLYSYTGASGAGPDGGMIVDPSGVLYGVTYGGGAMNQGAVYQLVPPATTGGAYTENVLYSFIGGTTDGSTPFGSLAIDTQGNLYGATIYGGTTGYGTVFELIRPTTTGGAWTETVLYNFTGLVDGGNPNGSLNFDPIGRLYGTASIGGASGYGVVFQLSPPATSGASWTYSVLYSFAGGNLGGTPSTGLLFGLGGALFGCTYAGGAASAGTVFSLAPPVAPSTTWTYSVLYSFTGGKDGGYPDSGLVTGSAGALYGVTAYGGTGYGTVYQLTPPKTGSTWTETALYDFKGGPAKDGQNPYGTLLLISHNVLLGTTYGGGSGNGTVFSLIPPTTTGGAWTESILYTFSKSTNGSNPYAGLVAGPSGLVFGTTFNGGKKHEGVIFSAAP